MEAHARNHEDWPPLSFIHPHAAPRIVSAAATLGVETTSPLEIVDLTDRVDAFLRAVHLETGWVPARGARHAARVRHGHSVNAAGHCLKVVDTYRAVPGGRATRLQLMEQHRPHEACSP